MCCTGTALESPNGPRTACILYHSTAGAHSHVGYSVRDLQVKPVSVALYTKVFVFRRTSMVLTDWHIQASFPSKRQRYPCRSTKGTSAFTFFLLLEEWYHKTHNTASRRRQYRMSPAAGTKEIKSIYFLKGQLVPSPAWLFLHQIGAGIHWL